jgi:phosphoribosylformylglycinamidine synthase
LSGYPESVFQALESKFEAMVRARVTVTLKNGVLDPQGVAIGHGLDSLGFSGVKSVRQGKVFDIELEGGDRKRAKADLEAMCQKLLANTVIEDFAVELL